MVQTSDQTWQAYNMYGGDDLYQGNGPAPDGRAYAVSYNRPLNVSGANGIFGSEYPMLQWLERNGYDVSYLSGVDVSTQGSLLLNHKVFMSSGHDEYWNQAQWDAVTAAKHAGVNLAFFAGNDVFWKTRLAASNVDSAANRTVVCVQDDQDGVPAAGRHRGPQRPVDRDLDGPGGGGHRRQPAAEPADRHAVRRQRLQRRGDHGRLPVQHRPVVA